MAKTLKAAKDAAEEGAPANHNGGNDEATFIHYVQAIVKAQAVVDEAKAAWKSVRKLAKAAGIELKKLDAIVTMTEWEPGEVRDHFATLNRYALWMGLPIGTQSDLFAEVPQAARESIDWEARGFAAAMTNKGAFAGSPPSDCPPDRIQDWQRGVNRCTEKLAWAMSEAGHNPERARADTAASRPELSDEPEGADDTEAQAEAA